MIIQRVSPISTRYVSKGTAEVLAEWDREYEDIVNCEYIVKDGVITSIDAVKYSGQWYIVTTKLITT